MTTDRHVVLLSGGIDSATVLALARQAGGPENLYALTVLYGQRTNFCEYKAARAIAAQLHVRDHKEVKCELGLLVSGNSLVGPAGTNGGEVPKGRTAEEIRSLESAPRETYVPARNTVLLAMALSWAESIGARHVWYGAVGGSTYPDCQPEFIAAFAEVANAGTQMAGGFTIHAPLIGLTKRGVVELGTRLGVDYSLTHSCYDPTPFAGLACGSCDACVLRRTAFQEAGLPDPTRYVQR